MGRAKKFHMLSEVGAVAPSEFLIFRAGINKTRKGDFLFDDSSLRLCLDSFQQHAADLMLDWEHKSLDDDAEVSERRASGWAQLEGRSDGSLWAVNVRWTDEARGAIERKEFRYTSPAFCSTDETPPRVTQVVNVALTNLPATDDLPPLVAANTAGDMPAPTSLENRMDLAALAAALGLPSTATAEECMAKIKELQACADSGGAPPAAASATPEDAQAMSTLLSLSGKPNIREAARHFAAISLNGEPRVQKLEAELKGLRFTQKLNDARQDGRVTLANIQRVVQAAGGTVETVKDKPRVKTPGDPAVLETLLSVLTPHEGIASSEGAIQQRDAVQTASQSTGKRFEDHSVEELFQLSQSAPEEYRRLVADRNARRDANH